MRVAILSSLGRTLDAFFPAIVSRMQSQGTEVVTASSTVSRLPNHTTISSITRSPRPRNFGAAKEVGEWLEKTSSDVLLTNTAVASFVARSRRQPCPVIYFCHGLHWNTGKTLGDRVWQTLEGMTIRNTDGVVTINDDDERWFSERMPTSRTLRLPGGIGLQLSDYPYSKLPPSESELRLVWAGDFSDRKRPQLAIDVIQSARELGLEVSLTMCGDGPNRYQVMERARRMDLLDRIDFTGFQTDMARVVSQSHGVLMTSKWEGLPRIALESLAIGRPVYAFDVKGVRSLPEVFLAGDGDVRALAQKIVQNSPSAVTYEGWERKNLDVDWAADQLSSFAAQIVNARGNHIG